MRRINNPTLKKILQPKYILIVVILLIYSTLASSTHTLNPTQSLAIVESESMMHCKNGPGQIAKNCDETWPYLKTITPADLVFTDHDTSHIETHAEQKTKQYGDYGDVILFQPANYNGLIIHRAMFYLEIHENRTYSIPEHQITYATTITEPLQEIGINQARLDTLLNEESGYITKGDNNLVADQTKFAPVTEAQLYAIAKGQIPFLGASKLFLTEAIGGPPHHSNLPIDIKITNTIILIMIFTPSLVQYIIERKKKKED